MLVKAWKDSRCSTNIIVGSIEFAQYICHPTAVPAPAHQRTSLSYETVTRRPLFYEISNGYPFPVVAGALYLTT